MICIFFFLSFLSVGRRHLFNINGYSRRAVLFLLIKKKKKKKLTRSLSQPHQHQKQQNFIHLETERKKKTTTRTLFTTILQWVQFCFVSSSWHTDTQRELLPFQVFLHTSSSIKYSTAAIIPTHDFCMQSHAHMRARTHPHTTSLIIF